jgi:hypothetical protein
MDSKVFYNNLMRKYLKDLNINFIESNCAEFNIPSIKNLEVILKFII